MFVEYSSPSEEIFAPCHWTRPSAGLINPQRILSRLVLPLPFAPVICSHCAGAKEKLTSLKILRSPRTQPRFLTSRMVACPPIHSVASIVLKFWAKRIDTVKYYPLGLGSMGPLTFCHSGQPPFRARTRLNPFSIMICAASMLECSLGHEQ